MKNTFKVLNIFALAAVIVLLGGCFSPWAGDGSSITIHVGGSSRTITPDELIHRVVIVGPLPDKTSIIKKLEPGTRTLNLAVTPGAYNITVTAYRVNDAYPEEPYLRSNPPTVTKEVHAGQSTQVEINMVFNDEGGTTKPDAEFDNIPDFKAWLTAQTENTAATPYNVKLNIEDLGGSFETPGSVGSVLYANEGKYVNIDLSDSTNITQIPEKAFAKIDIDNSVFPPLYTYTSCTTLTGITLPNDLSAIGDNAFDHCTNLTAITIPAGVEIIGKSAFNKCESLTSATINCVGSIGQTAFNNCSSLSDLTIGEGVTDIGMVAFYRCASLTAVTIPGTVKSIGMEAFADCNSLTSVTIEYGVADIGLSAFSLCASLTSVNIPGSVQTIGNSAFYKCAKLADLTIGDGVTKIDEQAFGDCASLPSVTIPASIKTIMGYAFSGCSSLISVTFAEGSDINTFEDFAFTGEGNIDYLKDAYTLCGDGKYRRQASKADWHKLYDLGDTGPHGGKIFYYAPTGFDFYQDADDTTGIIAHYLEALPEDSSGTFMWASLSFTTTNITGTETAIGTGKKNTAIILATDATAPAAKACDDYNGAGETDWFLPSKDELNQLYENKAYVDIISGTDYYWTSSQESAGNASAQTISSGYQASALKSYTYNVRPITAF